MIIHGGFLLLIWTICLIIAGLIMVMIGATCDQSLSVWERIGLTCLGAGIVLVPVIINLWH